jgi:BTB/POZ domain
MSTPLEKIMARRVGMINNVDALPDVTFLVGPEKKEFKAHKIFLATASEVFEAMFSKKFETGEGETKVVVVEDIEEGPFLQARI